MSVNRDATRLLAVLLGSALGACGGGGGGEGGANFVTADISTAAAALAGAFPALQEAEFDYLIDNPPPGMVSPLSLRSHLRPTLPPTIRPKRGGAAAGRAPMATSTEQCQDGGSTVYYDTVQKDVHSPYTGALFEVDREEDRDCTTVYSDENGTTTTTLDGWFEFGCPSDDPDCHVDYTQFGTPQQRSRFHLHATHNTYGEQDVLSSSFSVVHSLSDANYAYIDSYRYSEFDVEGTFIDNGEGGSGATHSYSYSGYMGTESNPWHVHDDNPGISVEGPYGISEGAFPGCGLGEAAVETLVPMYVDPETHNVVGTVEVTAGMQTALVEVHADGTADVTIGGDTTALSADQVSAIKAGCGYYQAESGS